MSVVIGKNQHGEVVFIRRDEDGTFVVLTCEDLDSLDELAGRVIVPRSIEDDDEDPPPDDGGFPLLLDTHRSVADTALRIDISDLPQGFLLFNPTKLGRTALEALEFGVREVHLDQDSAGKFGFMKALSRRSALEPGA